MTKIMNVVAMGTAMALAAVTPCAFAQDDLDNLLKELEGEAKAKPAAKPAAEAAAPATAQASAPAAAAKPEAVAEKPAEAEKPAVAEKPAEAAKPVEAEKPAVAEKPAEAAKPVEAEKSAVVAEKAEEPAKTVAAEKAAEVDPDAELIADIRATEKLRRDALDTQAAREIAEARECMEEGDFNEAVRHYGLAAKLLNDSPNARQLRKECDQGIAQGLYQAALQEDELGRHEKAVELMNKAVDMRHPKARRVLEKWNSEDAVVAAPVDLSDIKHRRNDDDYKTEREQIRKHLRRSRQYLAVRDMEKALEEVEVVLVNDPYNQEAIRIRGQIQKKRQTILQQERVASRDGMIADVDEAWRPVYAVNAAQLGETSAETVKAQLGDDPERTTEQEIERRMKEMRLPTISFKPPATIMDAVEFFSQASKDYDRPDIPLEKRGFNFALRTPQPLKAAAGDAGGESDDFSANANEESAGAANGLAPIPKITASDITFYEALKLVCDSVDYKFIVRGPVVMVMHKDMSTAELISRKYDVLDAFLERMTAASSDVKEMKSSGFGGGAKKDEDGEENQERDWKAFFEQMGVKWPEGSSIMHIKSLGKLYVRNTRENLAEFEKVLQEMGSQIKLIEIETRFVEVSQEDLNSLGFEWILNSDYSLNLGNSLGKALGVRSADWGNIAGKDVVKTWTESDTINETAKSIGGTTAGTGGSMIGTAGGASSGTTESLTTKTKTHTYTEPGASSYGFRRLDRIESTGKEVNRNLGINAFGGTTDYSNGNRYLSTVGNHISGESASSNDQFMRVNAFLGTADLSMILHMLSQRSDTDLLSAPKVVTKSGENAVIKVVTEYIYPQDYDVQLQSSSSGSSSSSGGGSQSAILAVVEPQNFTMREVGVILDVTPTYSEANGGTIDLEMKPQVVDEPIWKNYGMRIPFTGNSSLQSFEGMAEIPLRAVEAVTALGGKLADDVIGTYQDAIMSSSLNAMNSTTADNAMTWYDAPMEQPFFHVRSIDSKVSITPGATVVMGGLITEQRKAMDDKVPFLGDLPFVGRLFRSHAEQTIKRNLLIFVTGRLISPSGREVKMAEETADEAEVKAAPKAE